MEKDIKRSEKCKSCYLAEDCMLTVEMSKRCGGPWKDEENRRAFTEEHILEIKKETGKKPEIKGGNALKSRKRH